jgi:hypothetical protein
MASPSHSMFSYPQRSSPLASPGSSPLTAVQSRRRSQYKTCTPANPRRHSIGASASAHGDASLLPGPNSGIGQRGRTPSAETPQKAFLRERFKARCLQRVRDDRARAVRARRWSEGTSDGSSDGFDDTMMDYERDEDDQDPMQDEVCLFSSRPLRPHQRVCCAAPPPDHSEREPNAPPRVPPVVCSRGWLFSRS